MVHLVSLVKEVLQDPQDLPVPLVQVESKEIAVLEARLASLGFLVVLVSQVCSGTCNRVSATSN